MLVRSDAQGDELRQTRGLLFDSIQGGERLRRLVERFCCPGDFRYAARRRPLNRVEKAGPQTRLLQART